MNCYGKKAFVLGLCCGLFSVTVLRADQPIMNMMPRWDGGWGFQVIEEYRQESALLRGREEVGSGLTEEVHIAHLQGVYTWDRSVRVTVKIPYVLSAKRELLDEQGEVLTQRDQGLADATVALPLKKYFNLDARSGSWTLAPQLRVPLGGGDDYEIGDGQWGNGLSVGYETETSTLFVATGVHVFWFYGDEPFEWGGHLDLGYNFHALGSSGQLLWETDWHLEDDGSNTVTAGPALYWRFNDTVHARLEWKHDFYDKQGGLDHGEGETIKVGLGWVF